MSQKGDTLVRSPPSVIGVEMYGSPHMGAGQWREPSGTLITKISSGSSLMEDGMWRQTRQRDKKRHPNVDESDKHCGCGSYYRIGQLEHDLSELRVTHDLVLGGLHQQLDQLKMRNRDLTFQLLMGPHAGRLKIDLTSPESDDLLSPKSTTFSDKSPSPLEKSPKSRHEVPKKDDVIKITDDVIKAHVVKTTAEKQIFSRENQENIQNGGKIEILRRPVKGRSENTDPRMVRSLDFELLEEQQQETSTLLQEERAKNQYLSTLVEDLKRQLRDGAPLKGSLPRTLDDPLAEMHRTNVHRPLESVRPPAPSPSRGISSTRLPLIPLSQGTSESPKKRIRQIERSIEREAHTVLPEIPSIAQNTQSRRGKNHRGRARHKNQDGAYNQDGVFKQDGGQKQDGVLQQNSTSNKIGTKTSSEDIQIQRGEDSNRGRPRPIRSSSRGRGLDLKRDSSITKSGGFTKVGSPRPPLQRAFTEGHRSFSPKTIEKQNSFGGQSKSTATQSGLNVTPKNKPKLQEEQELKNQSSSEGQSSLTSNGKVPGGGTSKKEEQNQVDGEKKPEKASGKSKNRGRNRRGGRGKRNSESQQKNN